MAIKQQSAGVIIICFLFFLLVALLSTFITTTAALENVPPLYHNHGRHHQRMLLIKHFNTFHLERENRLSKWRRSSGNGGELTTTPTRKRRLIGSMAPTCTYNECRGCKYRCRAEQIPVDGNDPINSAYHYKCICHRP